MKKQIDLSVIVTCYNIEHYLKDCLDSLNKTIFPKENLEILLVDDGSTDGTPKIVDEYSNKYPYIKALHKTNGGVSLARNYGMDHASGKYIAFVDGDDIVPPNAYTDLMYTAEVHDSQVVVGFVKRFDNLRCHGSYLHKFAVKDTKINTTLDKTHSLLYDTTTWNKVYLRSFLVKNNIRFIPHILYEDLPFTLDVHLHSKRTSLIKDVVYYWRWRPQSITQSRSALSNFKSRINSLKICRQMLVKAGYKDSDSLMVDFRKKVMGLDIHIFLENIGDSQEDYIYKAQEMIYKFMRDWHLWTSPYMKKLPIKDQIMYYAVKTANFELLKKFTYVKNKDIGYLKPTKFSHHYKFEISEDDSSVNSHINYSAGTLPTTQRFTGLTVDEDKHTISGKGMFRIRNVRLFKKPFSDQNRNEDISAKLVNVDNHKVYPIHFLRKRTASYKRVLHPATMWTNSRYKFKFNYQKAIKALGSGNWLIEVHDVLDNKFWVNDYICAPSKASKALFNPISGHQFKFTDDFNTNWQLVFKARSKQAMKQNNEINRISNPQIKDGALYFDAQLNNDYITPTIVFDAYHRLSGQVINDNDQVYIKFDLSKWLLKYAQKRYQLLLIHNKTNKEVPYLFNTDHNFDLKSVNDQKEVLVSYLDRNAINVAYRFAQFKVNKYSLVNGRNLRVISTLGMPYHEHEYQYNHAKIVLVNKSLKNRYVLTIKRHQVKFNGRQMIFTIPLLTRNLKQLRVLQGKYHFMVYLPADRNHVVKTGLTLAPSLNMDTPKTLSMNTRDQVTYQVIRSDNGSFRIKIKQPWVGLDSSRSYRALAYTLIYPLMRMLPIKRNTIVFDSYWASQFSSNERSMYEYIRKHFPKMNTVWFFKNRLTPIDGNAKRVRVFSLKYWYYLATAKYLVQNANFPDQYFKRAGQIEVETLHGTFLKHMGFDEPHFKNATRKIQDNFARRNRRWDYMVVPSNYMKRTASQAFDYHQKVIESGFPRNDTLITHDNKTYINAIKKRLNIPLDKKVILYAPTYRKNMAFNFTLDLDRLQRELGDKYVFLVRLHYFVAHSDSFFDNPGFVYDVSDYPDINDLYLISDVMITDYSSVMFDYAYLKRPMIFYPYDKKMYLDDRNRGTYLNYDESMPGPIVMNENSLIHAIKNLDQVKDQYHDKLIHFYDRFAQFGRKGNATQQVVNTVLNTKDSQLDQAPDRHVIFNKFWHWFQIEDFQSFLLNYLGQVLPKRNIIMFESFFGTKYSDNPKAIYLYIKKHYPKYKLYWNVNPEDVPFFKKHHIPYVVRFSYRGMFKQAQAKYWITNARRPFRWIVPRNTIVLQTWHGTPLKTIGSDVNLVTMPGNNVAKYHQQVYQDNIRWNYLLIPNMYSEKIMPRAFREDTSQLMLTGYPRNDILVNASPDYVKKIKKRLGINPHKKVILYAPTWRDDEFVKSDEFVAHLHLDLSKFKKHYGNKVVVLVRTHYMISNHLDLSKYKDIAINVSDYQDIADLYLISDVLITDYSSVMFDYAILKRPIIFFDYDFDNYAKSTRGFYFDFRKIAPGPIVTTTDQVIQKLDPILEGHWHMSDKYRQFSAKFNKWMDGKATARVVHQLFTGDNVHQHYFTKKPFGLPSQVKVKDGAAMWLPDKDFRKRFEVNFYKNYDNDDHTFKVIKGMQLQSASFNELIGMKFVLIEDPDQSYQVWVNLDDLKPVNK